MAENILLLPVIGFVGLILATFGYFALMRGRRRRSDEATEREVDASRRRAAARFRRMGRRDRE